MVLKAGAMHLPPCFFVTDLHILLSFWHSLTPWECDKTNRGWPQPIIHDSQRVKKWHPKGTKHQILLLKISWTYGISSVDVRSKGVSTYGVRGWGRTSRGCLDVRARNLWTVLNETERIVRWKTAQTMLFCAAFEPHLSSKSCGMADIFRMSKCHSAFGPGKPVPLTLCRIIHIILAPPTYNNTLTQMTRQTNTEQRLVGWFLTGLCFILSKGCAPQNWK